MPKRPKNRRAFGERGNDGVRERRRSYKKRRRERCDVRDDVVVDPKRIELSTLRMRTVRSPS